ncbi:2-oxoglutarate ferredoxin oxidoreductase subunit delta [Desulfofundulus australicus DSM 11792]|uniref:2-oxoglutarate ferredoxin oxidoreductase subunit delta n=1 Tax=Desulfofundulus australicus DSM 11792 TaxID=1121425 RepID=A0A1M5AF68_9FIRM|nr:4Fe-4S binding protein [Desulfofundulus australicus]SHF28889.1 2-oxoglutarate ferredoxin oxidoreductase subunit delta [Desulfofundulus australicus DSM 11792]
MASARVTFREERCKGCGLCVIFCPKGIIALAEHINGMGFHPATVKDQSKCTGCATCARMCPDLVIEVEREVARVG